MLPSGRDSATSHPCWSPHCLSVMAGGSPSTSHLSVCFLSATPGSSQVGFPGSRLQDQRLAVRVCSVTSILSDCANLWTVTCQFTSVMGFSGREYWSTAGLIPTSWEIFLTQRPNVGLLCLLHCKQFFTH